MKLLYNITTALNVFLTDRYFGGSYNLWFAEVFNATANPPSSNPFHLFELYREIFRKNDRLNPKLVSHCSGLKQKAENQIADLEIQTEVLETIDAMGTHGVRPVLAILETDTYVASGKSIKAVSPSSSGSPTSVEFYIRDIQGPSTSAPELHLNHLYDT